MRRLPNGPYKQSNQLPYAYRSVPKRVVRLDADPTLWSEYIANLIEILNAVRKSQEIAAANNVKILEAHAPPKSGLNR
jgi:hypothetical protein